MRILITGASGFCGIHFCRHFLKQGHAIFAVVRNECTNPAFAELTLNPNLTVVCANLANLTELPPGLDAIIHAAATSPTSGTPTIERFVFDNIVGTHRLAAAAAQSDVEKIIYLSSLSLYGYVDSPTLDESTATRDAEPYGISKYMSELALREAARAKPSLSLRLPAILGKGAHRNWFVKTMETIAAGADTKIFNSEDRINHAIYVDDLCVFIEKLVMQEVFATDIITLGASGGMTIRAIAEKFKRRYHSASEIVHVESARKAALVLSTKAMQRYGYVPMDFEAILDRHLDNYQIELDLQ